MSDEPESEADLLRAQLEVTKQAIADAERQHAEIERLSARVAAQDERERRARIPTLAADPPPASAAEVLARREAELARLLADPRSSYDARHEAARDAERARASAAAEAEQVANFGRMARSLDVRAQEAAAHAEADRQAQREKAEHEEREREVKWGAAKRAHYVSTGQGR